MPLGRSAFALCLAVAAWAGCASQPRPMVDPSFAARTYTPARIAVLPPAAFMVLDQFGDNDPAASNALGRYVSSETVRLIEAGLRKRGYDVDLSARWDGIHAQDGQLLVTQAELDAFAGAVIGFANSEAGGGEGVMQQPAFIAPELAARIGWATSSDTLLYANLKGVLVTEGKRTAQVMGVLFVVVVVAVIVAILVASSGSKGNGGGGQPTQAAQAARPVHRAGPAGGGVGAGGSNVPNLGGAGAATTATRVARPGSIPPPAPGGAVVAPVGAGRPPAPVRATRPAYGGGYRGPVYFGPSLHVGVGVGTTVPVDEPVYTHQGAVADDDDTFAGDHMWIAFTLVSARDGRVLWHVRDDFDAEADQPAELERLVEHYLATLPPSLALGATPAPPVSAQPAGQTPPPPAPSAPPQ